MKRETSLALEIIHLNPPTQDAILAPVKEEDLLLLVHWMVLAALVLVLFHLIFQLEQCLSTNLYPKLAPALGHGLSMYNYKTKEQIKIPSEASLLLSNICNIILGNFPKNCKLSKMQLKWRSLASSKEGTVKMFSVVRMQMSLHVCPPFSSLQCWLCSRYPDHPGVTPPHSLSHQYSRIWSADLLRPSVTDWPMTTTQVDTGHSLVSYFNLRE